jgi:ABC-2 type transport system ATP-binding protein
MLEEQGLGEAQNRQIRQLSKGMAQKVQLIAAVAHEPELVILDEPFSGLDPVNQQTLETMIRGLAQRGATVVFSTHVMQHAERLCEHVVLLARGKKAFDGTVAEAKARAPRALVLEGQLEAEAAGSLPGIAGVSSTPLETGQRHVCALKAGASGQEALKKAFAQGLDIQRFELREPSLHDAFIVLTGEQLDSPEMAA